MKDIPKAGTLLLCFLKLSEEVALRMRVFLKWECGSLASRQDLCPHCLVGSLWKLEESKLAASLEWAIHPAKATDCPLCHDLSTVL